MSDSTSAGVFISWSGSVSQALARELRSWLPILIDDVSPYYTEEDVERGARWNREINAELANACVGLLCLTPDNLSAPWVLFEAGALAKDLESSRVCPLLFGVEKAQLRGPLLQFQAAEFKKADETLQVLRMSNSQLPEPTADAVLKKRFDLAWEGVSERVEEILGRNPDQGAERIDELEMVQETLELVRALSRSRSHHVTPDYIPRHVLRDLTSHYFDLVEDAQHLTSVGHIYHNLVWLGEAIEEVLAIHCPHLKRDDPGRKCLRSAREILREISGVDDVIPREDGVLIRDEPVAGNHGG